jgi:hypothetical protein
MFALRRSRGFSIIALMALACSRNAHEPARGAGPAATRVGSAQASATQVTITPPPAALQTAVLVVPSPPAAPEPPYVLDDDRKARIELAHTELGENVPTMYVAPVYMVAGGGGHNAASLRAAAAIIDRAVGAYANGRFTQLPTRALAIYLFPTVQTYHAYCRRHYGADCISQFGFYEPGERKMVMNGAGGTLTHELVHPMVEADFPDAPTWINEGLASLFEQPIIPRVGEIHGGKNWRLPRLIGAMGTKAEGGDAKIAALFGMPDDTFRNALEPLHYALARYFCQWLDERGQLWDFYHYFRDHHTEDPTGRAAFLAVTKLTTEEAEKVWTRWVRAL